MLCIGLFSCKEKYIQYILHIVNYFVIIHMKSNSSIKTQDRPSYVVEN